MTARAQLATIAAALMLSLPAAQDLSFEVASVKPNKSGGMNIGIRFPGVGQFNVINMPLREMIRFAYDIQLNQIEGGPDWIGSDRFDIIAKAEGKPTMPQVHAMMRSLLAERFALRTHRETREMPIYELVLARADKRLGSQLQPATDECRPVRVPNGAPKPPPPPPGGRDAIPAAPDGLDMRCGALFGPGFITLRQFTMDRFARDLTMAVRRVVVNRTGLEGRYDIDVEFAPEFRPAPPPGAPDIAPPPGASDGPSLFTAIQEQLGLKLESARGPVELVIVDHAERPTPD